MLSLWQCKVEKGYDIKKFINNNPKILWDGERRKDEKGEIVFLALILAGVLFLIYKVKATGEKELSPVETGGKLGYIDRSGNIVIKAQFDPAWRFSEGLARVKIGGKCGYIDKSGKIVIKPQFDEAGDFSKGRAGVKIGGKWGYWVYIDKSGKYVSPE